MPLTPWVQERVRQQELVARFIWGAFLFAIFSFGYFVTLAGQKADTPVSLQDLVHDPLSQPLVLLTVIVAVAALVLPQIFLTPEWLQRLSKSSDAALNLRTGLSKEDVAKLPVKEQDLIRTLPFWVILNIVSFALSELVAVLGLVVALMKQTPDLYLPFGLVAFVLVLIRFPRVNF